MSHPKYTGCIQTSIKSYIKGKEIQPIVDIQSNRVLKKNNLVSRMFLLMFSTLRAFLSFSLQIHHITWWRTAFQMIQFLWFPNHPCQAANRSTTDFCVTYYTLNNPNTIDHNSKAIGQWSNKWSTTNLSLSDTNTAPSFYPPNRIENNVKLITSMTVT